MSELKTKINNANVDEFISLIEDPIKQEDSYTLIALLKKITNEAPKMWGASIVGFGQYHYKSERSSQEADWPLISFSPRKQNLTLYFTLGFDDLQEDLKALGKHKTSKGCLYIDKLSDVDLSILELLIKKSFNAARNYYS
jgi:hypothetical protein